VFSHHPGLVTFSYPKGYSSIVNGGKSALQVKAEALISINYFTLKHALRCGGHMLNLMSSLRGHEHLVEHPGNLTVLKSFFR